MFGRLFSTACEQVQKRLLRKDQPHKRRRSLCIDSLEDRRMLAAGTFDMYRSRTIAPVGGAVDASFPDFVQPQIASLGDTIFASGSKYASISLNNGFTWQGINPGSVFKRDTTSWDSAGLSGSTRLVTDTNRGMVAWLAGYAPVIPVDGDGNPKVDEIENGFRLAIARSQADLEAGNWTTFDFSIYNLGEVKGEFLINPQMQLTHDNLYMSADVVILEKVDTGYVQTYQKSIWWRTRLDPLKAGGDIDRGVQFYSTEPIGMAGSNDSTVMYGASNVESGTTRIYVWNDGDQNPSPNGTNTDADPTSPYLEKTVRATAADAGITSFTIKTKDANGNDVTKVIPNKVQTGWVSNGQVGFLWDSDALPAGPFNPSRPKPFIRGLVLDTTTFSIVSQPDIFSSTASYMFPAAAANGRGDYAAIAASYTGTGPVSNDFFLHDSFTASGTDWDHYKHATATGSTPADPTNPSSINAGHYYGIMADDNFPNTWIAGGYIDTGASVPKFYWFGREQDQPQANLRGVSFDVDEDAAQAGDTITARYQVTNNGVANAGSFTVSFYASDDATITSGDTLLGTATFASLNAGVTSGVLTKSLVMPAANSAFWTKVGTGGYYVGMVIDSGNTVSEYDETDNASVGVGIDYTQLFPASFSNNDTIGTAADVGYLTGVRDYERLNIAPAGDQDWIRVTAPFDGTLTATITFNNANGNLDVQLYNAAGTLLTTSAFGGGTETATTAVTAGASYYIRVKGNAAGTSNKYHLQTDYRIVPADGFEPNDTFQTATDLGTNPIYSQANLSISSYFDEDYYAYTPLQDGNFTATVKSQSQFGNVDLYLYDQFGTKLAESLYGGNTESVTANLIAGFKYYLRVNGGGTDTNVYQLDYLGSVPTVYQLNNTIYVTGTNNDDLIELLPNTPTAGQNTVKVNGSAYIVDGTANKYRFDGKGGTDALIINGTTVADTFNSTAITVKLNAYTLDMVSIENLTMNGLAGDDIIKATGQRAVTIDGGDGNDTLYGGPLGDIITGGNGNDYINGGSGNDTLSGQAGDDTLVDGEGNDFLFGGLGNDIFLFQEPNSVQTDYVDEQIGGIDTFSFAQSLSPVTVNLWNDAAMATQGGRIVKARVAGGAAKFENIIGTNGNDTLVGNGAANRIDGRDGNDILEGRGGNDKYIFSDTTAGQVDTIREVSGGGSDTLDFSSGSTGVVVDLTSDSSLAVQGPRTIRMYATGQSAFIENVIGSKGDDILHGNAAANSIEGYDGDDLLDGRGGNDTYVFRAVQGTKAEIDTIKEVAGGGNDTLDFSGITSAAIGVTIDLRSTTTNIGSHLRRTINVAAAGQAAFLENISGGNGNDLFIGNAAANVLLGGWGRDILIGMGGTDTIKGGVDDDIVIGGTTNLTLAKLQQVQAEWVRTDADYNTRVSHLRGPVSGLNGPNFLAIDTVFDDANIDDLTGDSGSDWFWAGNSDNVLDQATGEYMN
jgi:Ca2+-binding RTX toxin-like protein